MDSPIITGRREVDRALERGDAVALCEMIGSARRAGPRFSAVCALGHLNNRAAIPALLTALDDRSKLVSRRALEVLAGLDAAEAGPPIRRMITGHNKGDRIVAAKAAGVTGDPGLLSVLGNALGDRSHTVRLVATHSIAEIGTDAARPLLVIAAGDRNLLVREAGRRGLNEIARPRA